MTCMLKLNAQTKRGLAPVILALAILGFASPVSVAQTGTAKTAADLSVPAYVSGGGTAQAQTATLVPAVVYMTAGLTVRWLPTAANTAAAPTLAVNGLAATTITKCGSAALIANDLTTTAVAEVIYDGTRFQLLNPQASGCVPRIWSCSTGVGDGLNAVPAGTYLQSFCYNATGASVTLTGLKCYVDGGTTSTMNAAGNTLGALLTGAVTCTTSFAAGTQSANVTLTSGDYIKFTFVADGTAKQTTWTVSGTY